MSKIGPLVDAAWLAPHLGDPDLRVIDFRWQEGKPGRMGYEAGHIPGAVFVDLDTEITGKEGPGRHPLPAAQAFQAAMRRAGVNRESRVVALRDSRRFGLEVPGPGLKATVQDGHPRVPEPAK